MRLWLALKAFFRPDSTDVWPEALLLGDGSALILADVRDRVFFEPGMSLELTPSGNDLLVRKTETGTLDRRKGRREAFADVWNSHV